MSNILILEGGRRTPRADILKGNRDAGLFARFSTTQLGGLSIRATLASSKIDKSLVGHVVMGMAQHSHRDSIYGAKGMAWRGGLENVPAGSDFVSMGPYFCTASPIFLPRTP